MKLAAKYPSKKIEGVSFFGVTSWRDTGSLAIEANAQQGLLIVDLFKELKSLKANAPSRQLVRRLDKLEKKLNAMRDGGYR
jgi:hypothetical protein